jgi:hypothetical protein
VRVLVHSCFSPYAPLSLGSSTNKIFHQQINVKCRCTRKISFRERDEMLARGEALVLVAKNVNSRFVPMWSEVVRTFTPDSKYRPTPLLGPTLAHCIGATDVEKYCDGKRGTVDFVESYREMDTAALSCITREYVGEIVDPWAGRCLFSRFAPRA